MYTCRMSATVNGGNGTSNFCFTEIQIFESVTSSTICGRTTPFMQVLIFFRCACHLNSLQTSPQTSPPLVSHYFRGRCLRQHASN